MGLWSLQNVVKRVARHAGVSVTRKPAALLDRPDAELRPNLAMLAAALGHHLDDVFFVQVGANDGELTDPFLRVAQAFDWQGVLIEPDPRAFERLVENVEKQPNFTCMNLAIDEAEGERPLFSVAQSPDMPDWVYGLSSFDRQHICKHEPQLPGISQLIQETIVRCSTFAAVLAAVGRERFDVLQIDTEGYDFQVLRMAEVARRQPFIVNFEHKHLIPEDWSAAVQLLIDADFKVAKTGQDTIAYRQPSGFEGGCEGPARVERCGRLRTG